LKSAFLGLSLNVLKSSKHVSNIVKYSAIKAIHAINPLSKLFINIFHSAPAPPRLQRSHQRVGQAAVGEAAAPEIDDAEYADLDAIIAALPPEEDDELVTVH